ncbi:MAG: hypothetical protein ABII18_02825 [bacterium]|nr:hypothetical protein [bacterium]MBU1917430.1 hypothetical protein [bacterium]
MKIINEINGNYSIDTTNLPDTFEEFEKKIKLKVKEINPSQKWGYLKLLWSSLAPYGIYFSLT